MPDPREFDKKPENPSKDQIEKAAKEAHEEALKTMQDPKAPKNGPSLDVAQRTVDTHFGTVAFLRQGVDADAAGIHDSVVPNPFQAGGMMDPKTKDETTLGALKNHDASYLKSMNDSYRAQYGHDMLDDMKANMTPDAYRRAQLIMSGEKDPGYLSPTQKNSEDALNSFKTSNGRPLSDFTDAEQLAAIQRNEAVKRGVHDELGVGNTHGPAQIDDKKVAELRKLYPDQLKDADPNTVDGAQKFVAAFNAHEADLFNNGEYGKMAKDMSNNMPQDRREKFERIQKEWDEAVARGDKDATRKLLTDRYNGGNPTQVQEVEAQRGQAPTGSGLRDAYNDAGYAVNWASNKAQKAINWIISVA